MTNWEKRVLKTSLVIQLDSRPACAVVRGARQSSFIDVVPVPSFWAESSLSPQSLSLSLSPLSSPSPNSQSLRPSLCALLEINQRHRVENWPHFFKFCYISGNQTEIIRISKLDRSVTKTGDKTFNGPCIILAAIPVPRSGPSTQYHPVSSKAGMGNDRMSPKPLGK